MKYKINLIPAKETPLVERLVYFSLNYLRYIIVITQLVVVGVFFYRFQIDQNIIDLKDAVDQKNEIVKIVLPLLNEASRIDIKSKAIGDILKKQSNFSAMNRYFISVFPDALTLDNMDVTGDEIKVSGSATDAQSLQDFYLLLKKDQKFATVNLQNIKRSDVGYDFQLDLTGFKN